MLKEALKIVDLVRKLKIKVTSLSKNGFIIETDSDVFYKNLINLADALEHFDNKTGSSSEITEEDKLRNSIVHLFKWLKNKEGVDIKEAHNIIKEQLLLEDKEDDEEIIRDLEEQLDYIPDDSLNLGEGAYANERKVSLKKDYTQKYPELEKEGTFNNTYISPLASLAAVGKSIQEMRSLIQEMKSTNDVENYLPELRSRLSFEGKRIQDTLNEQNILDWELEKSLNSNPDVLYNFSDDFEDNFGESLEVNLGLLERQVGSLAGKRNSASSLKLLKITSMLHKCKIRIMEEKKHSRNDRYFTKLENDINRLEKSVYVYVLKNEHNNKFKEEKEKKEKIKKDYENKLIPSMEFKPKNY